MKEYGSTKSAKNSNDVVEWHFKKVSGKDLLKAGIYMVGGYFSVGYDKQKEIVKVRPLRATTLEETRLFMRRDTSKLNKIWETQIKPQHQ